MFFIDLADGFFIYLFLGIGFIFSLWLYYDYRDKNLYQSERSKNVFHCVKCGKVYAAKASEKQADCPRCHFKNTHLQF